MTRLKEVRGCRGEDLAKALGCYTKGGGGVRDGYQDVDKALSKAGALEAGGGLGGELEDID